MKTISRPCPGLLLFGLLLLSSLPALAQWQTQSLTLQPGWNAVFLHVDASYTNLDSLVGSDGSNPISEVWLWQPQVSTAQFITSPAIPSAPDSQWAVWYRSGAVDTLLSLAPNSAYLVRNTNSVPYLWNLKGKPVAPRYQWATSGLNLIGFPTPAALPPNFDTFLGPVPELQRSAEIYRYPGGNLGATNPTRVFAPFFRNTPVTRGSAFWIRAGTTYNRYFGPFELGLQNPAGVQYADTLSTYGVRLKNTTASTQTITLNLLASETPPAGQAPFTNPPPLLLRGALNPTNLTYNYTSLPINTPASFTLAPLGQTGSELEIVLGLNRSAMTGPAGSLYAGILRFTDVGGLSRQDISVAASVATTSGLWVGSASISQVAQYLKSYAKAANDAELQSQTNTLGAGIYTRDTNSNLIIRVGTNSASYIVTGINTNLGVVARPFPLRLILHSSPTNTVLLQRIYYGLQGSTNHVLTTTESVLNPTTLATARRISAPHLPFSHPIPLGPSPQASSRSAPASPSTSPWTTTTTPPTPFSIPTTRTTTILPRSLTALRLRGPSHTESAVRSP